MSSGSDGKTPLYNCPESFPKTCWIFKTRRFTSVCFFTGSSLPIHGEGNVQRFFVFFNPLSLGSVLLSHWSHVCLPPVFLLHFPPSLYSKHTDRQTDRQGHMNWTLCVFFFLMMFFQQVCVCVWGWRVRNVECILS